MTGGTAGQTEDDRAEDDRAGDDRAGDDRAERRRHYAEEIAALAGLRSPALKRGFATVRREDFLPPGPWMLELIDGTPQASESDDPAHLLHAVGVVLDTGRQLHCANPARIARALQAADIQPGDRVLHVGAGLGYFTAILAELTGPSGQVLAAEIDPALKARAARHLAPWPQVTLAGDALALSLPPLQAIVASCGMAVPPRSLLQALTPGGRMVAPLTGPLDGGCLFLFRRGADPAWFSAEALSFVRYYPCQGLRRAEDEARLAAALQAKGASAVRSLRLDDHAPDGQCWLHGEGWCLGTRSPPSHPFDQPSS